MALDPAVIALLGFGEAGGAIGAGLAEPGGWRAAGRPGDNRPRRILAIDTALDRDARGRALGARAAALGIAIGQDYDAALGAADLVICCVPGENALEAAQAAARWIRPGTWYLDLCTVTAAMAEQDRAAIEAAGGRYVDVAVMGTFFGLGLKAPMLLAGPEAAVAAVWMQGAGFAVSVLGPKPGSASAVKMMRSVLIKGLEALAVESLTAARRLGLLEEVLNCLGDVDRVSFREYLETIIETHVVHARRRLEEMHLVAATLRDVDVPPIMTEAIIANHRRTVAAGIAPSDGKVPPLDEALRLLAPHVTSGKAP